MSQAMTAPELDINLRHLFVFMAVAKAGSVAAAAKDLLRASSAVARGVSKLESAVGVRLFDRRARGMQVNAYGRKVLERGERIAEEFAAASKGVDPAGSSGKDRGSHLVFSALPSGRRLAIVTKLERWHNMGAVARQLSVTQAAISVGLKEVEDRIGVPLFTRGAKGLIATEAGELVAFHFRRALAELRHIGPDLAAMAGTVSGTVKIGALPLGRTRILPSSIASVLVRYPDLHIVTVESPYDILAPQLRSGDIDFVFGALRPAENAWDLCQEALFEDCISVIARAGHPLASRRSLTHRDLRDARWVLWRAESPARESLLNFFRESGEPPPKASVETGDLAMLRGIILQSDMLAAISAQQLHYEIVAGVLVVLPIAMRTTRRSIGIAQRRGSLPSPGTRAVIEEIRLRVRRMIDEGELLKTPISQSADQP